MIATANLALSTRLQELAPGWRNTSQAWRPTPLTSKENYRLICIGPNNPQDIIAPDLDWLMDKLPCKPTVTTEIRMIKISKHRYEIGGKKIGYAQANNPTDAACALLIKLLEQKVISA